MRRPWDKLPPLSQGFERIPDDANDADGRRMCRCACGWQGPTLGIGQHLMASRNHANNALAKRGRRRG